MRALLAWGCAFAGRGIVAMPFSVLKGFAMEFEGAFCKGAAGGDPLDVAMSEARCERVSWSWRGGNR